MGCAEGQSPFAGSLRVSLRYNFSLLPGTRKESEEDLEGYFSSLLDDRPSAHRNRRRRRHATEPRRRLSMTAEGPDHPRPGRHNHPCRGRDRQRGHQLAARRRWRGWCDPQGRRTWAAGRVQGDRRLPDRRGKSHRRLRSAGDTRYPHRRPGLARRHRQRGRAPRVLLQELAGSRPPRAALRTIAFPSISTGLYAFPKERAAGIAVRQVLESLDAHPGIEKVCFVTFSDRDHSIYESELQRIA